MKTLKVIGITIVCILTALCLGIDAWWAYVYFYAPDKTIKTTYNIDLQTLKDGTRQALIEVQLFRNKDGKGLSAYEIKFNTVTDENRSAFYSYGAQYIGTDYSASWTGYVTDNRDAYYANTGNGFNRFDEYLKQNSKEILYQSNVYGKLKEYQDYDIGLRHRFTNLKTYYYQSGSDYYNAFSANNLIEDKDVITATVKIGDSGNAEEDYSIIGMRFKAFNKFNHNGSKGKENYPYEDYRIYRLKTFLNETDEAKVSYYGAYDSNYLAVALYNEIKDLRAGTDSYDIVKLGQYFDYASYDGKSYSWNKIEDTKKVEELVQSYCSIKITIHDEGLMKSSESLFNTVEGKPDFNLTNDYAENSYFTGRTNIVVDETMLVFIHLTDNKYAIKLKQSFIDVYLPYKDVICLTINVDKTTLLEKSIEVIGFSDYSGFENFVIHSSNVESGVQNV